MLDFAQKGNDDFTDNKRYYEFALKRNDKTLDLAHFYDQTFNNLLEPLIRFAYATKFFTEFVPANLGEAFAKNLNLSQNLASNSFYVALRQFMSDYFRPWLAEMAANDRGFRPFDLTKEFNAMVVSKTVETGFFDKGISNNFLKDQAGKTENSLQATFPQSEMRFMQVMIDVAEKCREKLGQLNRQLV